MNGDSTVTTPSVSMATKALIAVVADAARARAGKSVTTIEGLADGDKLHAVQEAWIAENVPQCGYCQPGQIMAAVDFLKRNPNPTDDDIRNGITNICRCGTYLRVRKAILRAAASMAEGAA